MANLRNILWQIVPVDTDLDLDAVRARAALLRSRRRAATALTAAAALAAVLGLGTWALALPVDREVLSPATPASTPATPPEPSATAAASDSVFVFFTPASSTACADVAPAERPIASTQAVATAALNELFKGPTEDEAAQGLTSFFSAATAGLLRSVSIDGRIAYVDLHDISGINNISTTCGSETFLAQLDATVRQFSTIDSAYYAVEGDASRFYASLERECPAALMTPSGCDSTAFSRAAPSSAEFPPQEPARHGGTATAVYLAVVQDPKDPQLERARAQARDAGYEVGEGDLTCDEGARETLGLDPEQSYLALALYFADQPTAERFVAAYGHDVVGIAQVTTYCLD